MFSHAIYKKAPPPLQSAAISLRALARKLLREGRRFDELLSEIERTQFLSRSDLAAWHEAKLGKLLLHAALHVPFYRELGLAHAVADASPIDALAAFPLIDKATVRENLGRFVADDTKRTLFKGSTSGTTGTPLVLYQDLAAINRENAFIWRQLKWAGLDAGGKRAWLRGDLVVPTEGKSPPFWRMNSIEKMLMFSSYHLSDDTASAYVDALERFDPVVIQAYPSSISFLAKWLDARGITYSGQALKGVVTSSESLGPEQRALIEQRFGCRVFDWYGQFERVAAIGTCEHGRLHIVDDYSFVELMPSDCGQHEITGTGYNNLAMPLIRYRTGDQVQSGEISDECKCGRSFPLITSIQGRADDTVKLPDGRHIGRLDHVFKGALGILEAQIQQDSLDRIVIFVVPAAGYSETQEKRLCANARERLGNSVQIEIRTVAQIPRTKNGKLRGVICNV